MYTNVIFFRDIAIGNANLLMTCRNVHFLRRVLRGGVNKINNLVEIARNFPLAYLFSFDYFSGRSISVRNFEEYKRLVEDVSRSSDNIVNSFVNSNLWKVAYDIFERDVVSVLSQRFLILLLYSLHLRCHDSENILCVTEPVFVPSTHSSDISSIRPFRRFDLGIVDLDNRTIRLIELKTTRTGSEGSILAQLASFIEKLVDHYVKIHRVLISRFKIEYELVYLSPSTSLPKVFENAVDRILNKLGEVVQSRIHSKFMNIVPLAKSLPQSINEIKYRERVEI